MLGRTLRFEDLTVCLFNILTGHHQELTPPGKQRLDYVAGVVAGAGGNREIMRKLVDGWNETAPVRIPGTTRGGSTMDDREKSRSGKQQSQMVAGVCVPHRAAGYDDYDELLREALRVALRIDTDPTHDNFHDLYTRIDELMDAYIRSPEGDDASTMMARLAVCIIDVIPLEQRCRAAAKKMEAEILFLTAADLHPAVAALARLGFSIELMDWTDEGSRDEPATATWIIVGRESELDQSSFLKWMMNIVEPLGGDVVTAGRAPLSRFGDERRNDPRHLAELAALRGGSPAPSMG